MKSAKLDPHTEEGYLVGFKGSYIYCIYLPGRSQKIVRTLYYIFNELLSNQADSQDLENLEEDIVSNKVLIPKGIPEDTRLDQVYDPLPNLLAAQSEEEAEEVIIPQPYRRGRPKGSKNKPRAVSSTTEPIVDLTVEPAATDSPVNLTVNNSIIVESADTELIIELNPLQQITRSSVVNRQRNPALYISAYSVMLHIFKAVTSDIEEPKSVAEAQSSPD
jgi:hypothetical protein